MKAKDIQVNQLIEIEVDSGSNVSNLPSRVEEVRDDVLYISMPMRKGVLVPLSIGQKIKINIKYKQSIFAFLTTIIGRRREPIPTLIVNKPDSIIRINQKREYVRLATNLPLRFKMLTTDNNSDIDEENNILRATTIDISAGGVLFTTKDNFKKTEKMEIELKLSDHELIICTAKVVRIFEKDRKTGETRVAVEFDNINEGQRDKIFRYIFEKQREWIKRGLVK